MRFVEFRRYLADNNALRVRFALEQGRVVAFTVQLECRFEDDEWIPVVRYDTAHGFAHCDLLHPYDPAVKTEMATTRDYNEALTLALHDLENSWCSYRRRYEEWLRQR